MTAAELRWMLETAFHGTRRFPGPVCTECHCAECMPQHPKDRCAIRLALIGSKRRPAPRGSGKRRGRP